MEMKYMEPEYTEKTIHYIREKLTKAGLLPLRAQAKAAEKILEERLHVYLPKFMEETGFDMWVIASHETNEDPIMWTMTTPDIRYARRCNALIFYRDPRDGHMEYLAWMTGYEMSKYYQTIGTARDSFVDVLKRECDRLKPQKIGVNTSSELGGFCGGLSAWLYNAMQENLPEEYRNRLHPAGRLATRWLETMTEEEKKVMHVLSDVTEDIMKAFFSRNLIKPGKTTVDDVKWWIKDVMARCELNFWFPPHLDYQRKKQDGGVYFMAGTGKAAEQDVILEGDLLHCDVGVNLKYIRVLTDRQWMCYLKRADEKHAPCGLKRLFKMGNLFQDIVAEEFQAGRNGEDVFWTALGRAREAGIDPMLYCHGLGTYGHSAGPIIGLFDFQDGGFPRGDIPVGYSSTHALELMHKAKLPEWDDQEVCIFLEEDVNITDHVSYFGKRETALLEI